jgi:hemerythrin-like domain-containing protein
MANLSFPGFDSPAAGPEAPLDMLAACHERMERQFATLRRLVLYLGECGTDEQARQAAQAVMRYFDSAAPNHHADEEEDLFPALIESMAGSDAVCLRELTQGLAREHRTLEAGWRQLRKALAPIAEGQASVLAAGEVEAFIGQYRSHLEREDSELLPMARRLLTGDALAGIGRAMRERRGIAAG